MQPQEFDEKNLRADMAVVEFNAKYAKRIVFVNTDSYRKGKVIGLIKFLSVDGKTPFSGSFAINKKPLSIADINKANSILLMVNIELLNANQVVPLDVFLQANSQKPAPQPPGLSYPCSLPATVEIRAINSVS